MALFNCCNGLVGRGVRPAMSAGSPAPAPGPRTNGGGRGRGGFQPGLAVRAQNIGLLAQVLAGALFVRPPPALPRRPGVLALPAGRIEGLEGECGGVHVESMLMRGITSPAPSPQLPWCSKIHKWLVRRGGARREIPVTSEE
jgi:hypothetical protein